MPGLAAMFDFLLPGRATDPDAALVEAFRKGDRRAFETLVKRHQRQVWGVVSRFVSDRDAAEDVAQRSFVQALERIGDLRGAFRPWLLRIAANLAKNHLRDQAKFVDPESVKERGRDPRPDEALDADRLRRRVRDALAQLGERQRDVVTLRVDADLSFAEIGDALGITENNAKVTYFQAVRRLREHVGPEELP